MAPAAGGEPCADLKVLRDATRPGLLLPSSRPINQCCAQVKLALCQLGVSSDKQANLRLAGQAVKVQPSQCLSWQPGSPAAR